MSTYDLELTWPITDPDMSLGDLKAQAAADLKATLAHHGLQRAGHPLFAVTHGAAPAVTVRLLVTGHPAIDAGPIEATQAHEAETADTADQGEAA